MMNTTVRFFSRLAFSLLFFCQAVPAQTLLLTAERMFDADAGTISGPVRLLVEDGVIRSLNPDSVPAGTGLLDLGDRTLLPGLMDMHTHLTDDYFTGDDWVTRPVFETAADYAIRGVAFAERTLMAGFTTVRNLGALPGFPDVALARAIARGFVPGPDVWTAGHYISTTGGHCDITGFAPGIAELGPEQGIANGVDEVIKAVRYQAKHGASVIKVCATGGVFSNSQHAPVGAQQYSDEELKAIVDEAARLGLKVAAHAHGTEGINAAVRAGVASIEHGSIFSEETVELMKKHGTFHVPNAYLSDIPLPPETPQATVDKSDFLVPLADESIRMSYRHGVKMALGTDAGVFEHGDNGREFAALVKRGLSEAHALQMATVYAAELLGVDDRGVLKEGKRADIIAVDGNPLEDIRTLEQVRFVMKKGVVYKQP